jgi:hypothetical protein
MVQWLARLAVVPKEVGSYPPLDSEFAAGRSYHRNMWIREVSQDADHAGSGLCRFQSCYSNGGMNTKSSRHLAR